MAYKTSQYRVMVYRNANSSEFLAGVHEMTVFPSWSDIKSLHEDAMCAIIKGTNRGHEIANQLIHKNFDAKYIHNIVD